MTRREPLVGNCRWIAVPGAADARGRINFVEPGKGLPFAPQRLFWLHDIAPGQWRGRHAHRRTELVLIAMSGSCRVSVDDGRAMDEVTLDDPALALHIGTWVWHELSDFAPGAVVLAVASTLYDEAEYMRDFETFKREVADRR
ncbi:MAG: FdtA/QdtA family cupin domain-containing protein [Alphaproteobacteria bacterium]|nr:FdtA/QdtA family cupin domain-containing protein [Alphaproteobacteria bacterium]MBV8411659.1 FdtA/QdtA family cupin domain-containing protein [Alphaproteobacteria bacterium]